MTSRRSNGQGFFSTTSKLILVACLLATTMAAEVDAIADFDVERYTRTQEHRFCRQAVSDAISIATTSYAGALDEIQNQHGKQGHWRWYIIPNEYSPGSSATGRFFGIQSRPELRAYIRNDLMGNRLIEMYAAIAQAAEFHRTAGPGNTGFAPLRQVFDGARMEYFLNRTNNYQNFRVMCADSMTPADVEAAIGNVERMKQIILGHPVWSRFLGDAGNFAKHIELFMRETRVWLDEPTLLAGMLREKVQAINDLATYLYARCVAENLHNNGAIPSAQYKMNPSAVEYNQVLAERSAILEEINNGGGSIAVPLNGQIFLHNGRGVDGCVDEMHDRMADVNGQALSEAECRLYKPDQGYRQTDYARQLEGRARRQRFEDARAMFCPVL